MQLSTLTPTNLKRFNASIYAIKELIQSQHIDEYEFMTETLMMAYYGIEQIASDIEAIQQEERIKRTQEYMNKQK